MQLWQVKTLKKQKLLNSLIMTETFASTNISPSRGMWASVFRRNSKNICSAGCFYFPETLEEDKLPAWLTPSCSISSHTWQFTEETLRARVCVCVHCLQRYWPPKQVPVLWHHHDVWKQCTQSSCHQSTSALDFNWKGPFRYWSTVIN